MKYLGVLVLALVMTACTSVVTPLDGEYQMGDTSKSVAELRDNYCEEVTAGARLGIQALITRLGGQLSFQFCEN